MSKELFEHTAGQGKEDEDSKKQIEAAQFSEKIYASFHHFANIFFCNIAK